jgi:predicted GTPase
MKIKLMEEKIVLETFGDFRPAQLSMLGNLKKLREFAETLTLQSTINRVEEMIVRTESDSFSIAIVGEFKRGKSTLINALLGQEIMPADVLPCSATLNRVKYSHKRYVELVFKEKDGEPERTETIAVEELKDYVTKLTEESEAKASTIKEAIVYYPVHYCRHTDIIDTPGLNDDATMTELTYSVLSKVDAAILVILATAPFAESESSFLNDRVLTNDIGRVIFVINRLDQIPESDQQRLLDAISTRIDTAVSRRGQELYGKDTEEYHLWRKRMSKPKVFGLSAQQALDGKVKGDEALLAKSGLNEFETVLEKFIIADRGNVMLQVMADCAVTASRDILAKINLQKNGLSAKGEEFEAAYAEASARLDILRQRYVEESHWIGKAAETTKLKLRPLVTQFGDDLRSSAEQIIDGISIQPAELKHQDALSAKISGKIEKETQRLCRLASEKIQLEIQRELQHEVMRWGGFANEVQQGLIAIEMGFANLGAESAAKENSAADMLKGLPVALFSPLMGGIWAGYREAGLKGAGVGAVAGFGASFSVVFASLILGFPVGLPIMLVAGVAALFAGKFAGKYAFAKDRVENFKSTYKQAALNEMNEQWKTQRRELDQQVDQQVDNVFAALAQHIEKELSGPINQTQASLDEIRSKRERSEVQTELELKQLEEMYTDTHRMQAKAIGLSESLRQSADI